MRKLFFLLTLVCVTFTVNAQHFFVDTTSVDCTKKSTMFLLEGTRYENASSKKTLLPVRRLASDSVSTLGRSLNSVLSQMTAGDCFVNLSVSPNAGCPFQAVTVELRDNLGNPLSTASGYSWIFSTGQANVASITLYPSNTMDISVTVQYWSGGQLICEQILVRTIVVKPIPLVNLEVIPNAVCMGEDVQFTLTDMNHNPLLGWPTVWSTGQVNVHTISFTPTVNTPVSVIATDPSSGCSTTLAREAIVYPKPWVMIAPANPTLCGGSITLGVTLEVVGCPFIVWSDGTIGSTINVTSTGQYTVTVTDDNGCSGTATVNVTPGLAPSVNFTANVNGMTASFQNFSSNGTSRIWNFGDGGTSSEINPTHTYAFAGTYTVVLTESNGCGIAQSQKNITIQQPILYPVASFSPNVTSGCGPLVVLLTNASQNAQTFSWVFEGGTPSTFSGQYPPPVTFNTTGGHVVTLLVSNQNGSNSTSQTILVTGLAPVAQFLSIENLMNVSFVNQSQNATSYHWTFGDGGESFLPNPSHTYPNTQPYTVSLTAYNSCGSDTKLDTVNPTCMNLVLGSTAPAEGIQVGDCIYLSADAIGVSGNDVQYTWSPSGPLPNGPFGFEVVACPTQSMYFYVEAHNLVTGCITVESIWVKVWGGEPGGITDNEELEKGRISVIPNPASDFINVTLPEGDYVVYLFDIAGKEVKKLNTDGYLEVDIQSLPAGQYFLHITEGDEVIVTQNLTIL